MGYQLVFWQQGETARPPLEIYRALLEDLPVPDVRRLPMTSVVAALGEAFPEFDPRPEVGGPCPVFWDGDGPMSVELSWSEHHVVAELRGRWPHAVANRMIDVMLTFGCPLFDPQTNERFGP